MYELEMEVASPKVAWDPQQMPQKGDGPFKEGAAWASILVGKRVPPTPDRAPSYL